MKRLILSLILGLSLFGLSSCRQIKYVPQEIHDTISIDRYITSHTRDSIINNYYYTEKMEGDTLKVIERLQNIYITTSHDTVYRDSVIVREVEIDKTDYAKLDQLNQSIGKLKVYGYLGYILAGILGLWLLIKELRQKRQRPV